MAIRWYEIKAAVYSGIYYVFTVQSRFTIEIGSKLVINIFNASLPTSVSVQIVAKSWSVDNCQAKFHAFFFDFHCGFLNFNSFFQSFIYWGMFSIRIQIG